MIYDLSLRNEAAGDLRTEIKKLCSLARMKLIEICGNC